MGNKKNKYTPHQNRGKYVKKVKNSQKEDVTDQDAVVDENISPPSLNSQPLNGSRIINLHELASFITHVSSHSHSCKSGTISLVGETHKNGLASILYAKCNTCNHELSFATSQKVGGVGNRMRWEANVASVWGQMATGGGHARLEEVMALLGVPVMSKKSFIATESALDKAWLESLNETMKEAAEEEKRIAISKNCYHNGVPAISVVVDAGWSKRSHKHSYNAKSGVGIVVGKETKKLLHVGVRNKYCSVCARAKTEGKEAAEHECHKNWEGASSSMETSIIVEAFKESESKYGLRYTEFVGDGDSSVYPNLITEVPEYGHDIVKVECSNHAVKCYRSALEKLAQEKPHYKGKGGLTSNMRKRLTKAARCAIKMRSAMTDRRQAVRLLRQDLRNGPMHCFGVHTNCSTDFCKAANTSPDSSSSSADTSLSPDSSSSSADTSLSTDSSSSSTNSSFSSANTTTSSNGSIMSSLSTSSSCSLSQSSTAPPSSATTSWNDCCVDSIANEETEIWNDALDEEDLDDVRSSGDAATDHSDINPELIFDVQRLVGRLIAKADQLLGKKK